MQMKTTAIKHVRRTSPLSMENLHREVTLLRSVVIGLVGRDPEGDYRPELVREVFRRLEKEPTYEITSTDAFLKRLDAYVPTARR